MQFLSGVRQAARPVNLTQDGQRLNVDHGRGILVVFFHGTGNRKLNSPGDGLACTLALIDILPLPDLMYRGGGGRPQTYSSNQPPNLPSCPTPAAGAWAAVIFRHPALVSFVLLTIDPVPSGGRAAPGEQQGFFLIMPGQPILRPQQQIL